MKVLPLVSSSLLLCVVVEVGAAERWFDQNIVAQGEPLFQQHCAICHGSQAEGTRDWKKTDANGHYPPPPLNGSAHTWHHSIQQLMRSINQGGKAFGGIMPGFNDKLSDRETLAVIAFFQSKWSDQVYKIWHDRFMPAP